MTSMPALGLCVIGTRICLRLGTKRPKERDDGEESMRFVAQARNFFMPTIAATEERYCVCYGVNFGAMETMGTGEVSSGLHRLLTLPVG